VASGQHQPVHHVQRQDQQDQQEQQKHDPPSKGDRAEDGEPTEEIFDFVVVGAGSSGSVLAAKLARTGATVALLDAGSASSSALERSCEPLASAATYPDASWSYVPKCSHHKSALYFCKLIQGRVLGGGAAVNNQIYTRSPTGDFPYWSPDSVVEGYEALEAELPRVLISPTRSQLGGPLRAIIFGLEDQVAGLRWRLDPHEPGAPVARISGFLRSQTPWKQDGSSNTKDGLPQRVPTMVEACGAQESGLSRRTTPYTKLVGTRKVWQERRLQVVPNTTVSHVLFQGKSAVGVAVADGNQSFFAGREVILSAGAIGTAQILHSSGLAPLQKDGESYFPLQDKLKAWVFANLGGLECERSINDGRHSAVQVAFLNASSMATSSTSAPMEFELTFLGAVAKARIKLWSIACLSGSFFCIPRVQAACVCGRMGRTRLRNTNSPCTCETCGNSMPCFVFLAGPYLIREVDCTTYSAFDRSCD